MNLAEGTTIMPDVMMFLNCDTEIYDEKAVIKITIQKDSSKPYFLKDKGMIPSGVYVRQGAFNAQATYVAIRKI